MIADRAETAAKVAKRARRALGLTQRGFAPLIGVTQATVARWEKPDRDKPEFVPSHTAFVLLRLIAAAPEVAAVVLKRAAAVRPAPRKRRQKGGRVMSDKSKKRDLKKAARQKVVEVEKALTTGDLDTRKERVKEALSKPPLASERLKGGSVVEPKADDAKDED